MKKTFIFALAAILGFTTLTGSISRADCLRVLSAWEFINGYSTGANSFNAFDARNSRGYRALSGLAALAAMVAINQDENERELIAEGNQSIDGPMIEKMRAGMNQILAKQGRQLITPETLYGLVSQANVSEKICTKWGGAYSQSGIEKILLTQVP